MIHRSASAPARTLALIPTLGIGLLGLAVLVGEYGRRQVTQSRRSLFRDEPRNWGLDPPEELTLRARDGIPLDAWLFEAREPAPSVIVVHGHGGNKDSMLPLAQILFPRFNLLLLDTRGHGASGGTRTTLGYEERLDVHAAVDELIRRGLGPVGILGISMGAAIAIIAAADDPRIAAVIADSPFARLPWAVAEAAKVRGYPPVLAPLVAQAAVRAAALRLGYPPSAFDPIEAVERIAPRPLLLIHGEHDTVINARHSRLILERAGEPKELWILDGLAHCRGLEGACDAYGERLVGFFRRVLPRPPSVSS